MTQPRETAEYRHADFVAMALAEFTDLHDEFEQYADLSHLQMAAFARLTQQAKMARDWETYDRCTRLAERLWPRADRELRNALEASYVENLDFDDPDGDEAWARFPSVLQENWLKCGYVRRRLPEPNESREG